MTLTEALLIARGLSSLAVQSTAYDPATDPMLRSVCRWRATNSRQFFVLLDSAQIGRSGLQELTRGVTDQLSVRSCICDALRAGGCEITALASRCRCSYATANTCVQRLKRTHPIVATRNVGRRTTYTLTETLS